MKKMPFVFTGTLLLMLCLFSVANAAEETNFVFTGTENETAADDLGIWELRYYVDEFKRPTNESYIRNADAIYGTFSNSATSNSKLVVYFLIEKDDVAIVLAEYGRSQVKNSSSKNHEKYNVTMLDAHDKKTNLSATLYASGDRLYFSEKDVPKVIRALSQDGPLSFYIVHSERSVNSYVFTIENTSHFSKAYALLGE